jgi:hypothetical protein
MQKIIVEITNDNHKHIDWLEKITFLVVMFALHFRVSFLFLVYKVLGFNFLFVIIFICCVLFLVIAICLLCILAIFIFFVHYCNATLLAFSTQLFQYIIFV